MRHHPLIWSFNTITQKQFKYDPAAEIVHKGPLMDVLDKLLPSMGRRDIPSHVVAIINFHGPGVLEMPGEQRWDGLRLHYRNDSANLILDYDAYKSNLSVTSIKQDGTVSIESMSELKLDKKFNEEDKMKDSKPEMNVPLRWLGESEMNPEAIEYAKLDEPSAEADLVDTVEDGDMELKLRKELRRARDRTNTRIGAVGTIVGSHAEVVKVSIGLKEYLASKRSDEIAFNTMDVDRTKVISPLDYPGVLNARFVAPRADFDGDEIQILAGAERLRRVQWRTRNPDITTFIKEGRELYEGDVKPIAVLKTNFEDYVLLVNLLRRDIYRNDTFISAALLIKALYSWGGVVRADRKTALRFIKKTYSRCVSGRFRPWLTHAIWEYKDQMIRSMLMDGSKREFIGNRRGMHRRMLSNVIHACPTLTCQCMTGDDMDK